MASPLNVSFDLSALLEVGPAARAHIFGALAAAVQDTAAVGEERWRRAALKAPLWEGERQAYANSITHRSTGEFSAEIVSDYKYVEDIETGRAAYDMKRMLNTSLKVRVSSKGRRYLIIPFRHNTPGHTAHAPAMSAEVYKEAKSLSGSRVTGGGMRLSGTGAWDKATRAPAMVPMRKYVWGGRVAAGLTPKLKTGHKSDPTAGMVRMQTTSPGGKQSSSYMTFRVMTEGSSGWIRPAQPGLFIAKAVADSLQRTAESSFSAAVARDLG